jgi:hypothetical protein
MQNTSEHVMHLPNATGCRKIDAKTLSWMYRLPVQPRFQGNHSLGIFSISQPNRKRKNTKRVLAVTIYRSFSHLVPEACREVGESSGCHFHLPDIDPRGDIISAAGGLPISGSESGTNTKAVSAYWPASGTKMFVFSGIPTADYVSCKQCTRRPEFDSHRKV